MQKESSYIATVTCQGEAEKFVVAWQESDSLREVSQRLKTNDVREVSNIAARFRRLGVPLKHMPQMCKPVGHGTINSSVDLEILSKLARKYLPDDQIPLWRHGFITMSIYLDEKYAGMQKESSSKINVKRIVDA